MPVRRWSANSVTCHSISRTMNVEPFIANWSLNQDDPPVAMSALSSKPLLSPGKVTEPAAEKVITSATARFL